METFTPTPEDLARYREDLAEHGELSLEEMLQRDANATPNLDGCPVCDNGRLLHPGIQCRKCFRFGERE